MNNYQLPGFEFVERIGQGAFADVWKAKQTILGRNVAVKILTSTATDDVDYELFTQECQALARLERAPNIVQVFDAGVLQAGHPFIVLEFVGGGTLQDFSRQSRPSEAHLLDMLRQATSGLQSAHEIEVLHRDIKPENLLLRSNGDIVLSDFGVARLSVNERTQTSTNEPGTIRYMAPEVIEGTAPSSERSDIYSLAMTFWSVAAQRQPFDEAENAAQVIVKATTSHLEPLTTFDFSDELSFLLERCLSKNPGERPDASELLTTLSQPQLPARVIGDADATIRRRPQTAKPVSATKPAPTPKTNLLPVAIAGGLVVAAISGFAVFRFLDQPGQAADSTTQTTPTQNQVEFVDVGASPTRPLIANGFV